MRDYKEVLDMIEIERPRIETEVIGENGEYGLIVPEDE